MKKKKMALNVKIIIVMFIIMFITIGLKCLVEAGIEEQTNGKIEYYEQEYEPIDDKIDVNNIIEINRNRLSETIEIEEMDLEYITKYQDNNELPKGLIQVVQEGRNGTQEAIIKKTYENEELISTEQIGSKVTKSSVDKIVEIGTANYKSTYKVRIGDTLYVTSNSLTLRREPNINSENVSVINKNDSAKLLEIYEEWYKIVHNNEIGWVNSNCMTYIAPNQKHEDGSLSQKSKAEQYIKTMPSSS